MGGLGKEEAAVEILKARTDKREYRRIVLKNSLEVLLISDPETDKCAASMNVRVGSFSEPDGLEGLAHFLEHMLFYASEKYPDEDSYSKYISEHGGYTNAFTSDENTNYNFDVNAENFEEALDRFAQFFIKPLMSPDATMREIRAVNSENQKNLLSDTWRMDQLQKHLSSKDHPYHRFSTGNLDSLDVWPKERGVDTRLELLSFYEEHYSANIMHLVVYAKENLDKIESLVENIFQEIPNKERSSLHCTGQPCTSEHLQILVKAIPIKQGHELRVVWPATPDIQHYKEGASCYLSHLIGHEGNGSLFCTLKKLGWATYLYAGETEWTNDFSFFSVIIDLTDAGHEHMEDVVGMLFKYIDLLQKCGICEWIFNELSAISETRFHYRDKVPPVDYVINIASNMQFYPPNDWLVGSSLPSKFNPGRIQLLLDELNPNNIRIFWSSMKFEGHAKMIEPWYGTAYCAEKITESMVQLLVDYLNEYAYDAQIAGLGYSIHVTRSGFQVSVGGYNHKLRILLETIIEKVVKFEVKPDRFYVIKETITKDYQNIKFQQPHEQAGSYCSLILHDHSWPWTDELEALTHLQPDNLAKFAPLMLSRTFLQCYIAGNIGPTEAESVIQKIEDIIFNGPHSISKYLLPSQHLTNRVAKLAGSTNFFYPVEGLNPSNENSALIHYIQVHQDDFVLNVKLRLFCLIGKQAAFHQLRTVEQLGYVTSMSRRSVIDYGFLPLLNYNDPIHLYMRVESFLETFENQLCELSDDEFKSRVNALIDMKLEKYKNLWEESCFYWHEISNGTLKFDRTERECAASMEVRIGSFCDPDGLEGLAHFLEHMLFYASEKYPLEDSYAKYITEHGGSTNAFTASEYTNYYFDVNVDCFEEALDRFAQFFIKPLMSADATTREIKAVDSGNWDTLEVKPKARGMDTRQELLKLYEENYSSNLMHLVVYAKEGLDKIQSMVEYKFQEIRNIDRNCPSFPGHPCSSEHLQVLVKAVPIKQGHKLRIIWPITPCIRYYEEGPSRYLSHLIGHEGEGSVFYVLKTLGWATSLSAGESDWTCEFSFFKVVIDLTDAGHEHVEDIVGLVFKYVHLLQQSGPCKWIFDELSAIAETVFHYQDKTSPIHYVVNVASNMQLYPPKDWLVGSSLPSIFSPSIIQSTLSELTPNNVRIFWESTKFEGHTDKTEPWYGTAYSVEKITGSIIQQWMKSAPDEHLHLPAPNVFIPTDLSLRNVLEKVEFPLLLRKSSYSRLWYKPDTRFSTPKAYVKIDFNCPYAGKSPEAEVLTDMFTRLLMDYLNEYAYYAQVAGLYYAINHTGDGFQVTVVGYNHKLRILVETVIEKMAKFEVKPERFAVIKEMVAKDYQNFKFQQPYQQAMYYCSLILADQTWPWNDGLEALPHLQADNLSQFFPLMLSRTFLECYISGNMEPNEAESMIQHIEGVLFNGPQPISQALFPSQHLTNRVIKLERGISYFYPAEGLNPSDENSALVHYIQVHQDEFLLNVKLQLFALIAKQPAFHQLRSVEQLGYITVLMQRNDSGIRGVQFIIQSTAKGPRNIGLRVEAFLKMFESKLYEMSDDEFKSNVTALIDMKLEKHKNLRDESAFYWREISDGTLKFDRRACEVAALKQLTQKELIDFFDEYVKVGARRKKALSIQVYGSLHNSEYKTDQTEPNEPNSVRIDDIFSFRRSHPLYGSFKGVMDALVGTVNKVSQSSVRLEFGKV
ncbi:hypothetical protein RHMOL_Rhmol03G0019100 [Rhododendron molle]|uniref:Uncharacterized protein n=1 Tax=Rhododendron molle TaxID=49168 RepID=A0ACC0PC02_RHOML|nr:hypothetical protein RHMOL_Rhmol03G0019100 [Rhododendron molle]